MYLVRSLLIFFIFFLSYNKTVANEKDNGTLIVTYQTNENADRIDRIRFWLVDKQGSRCMYPIKNQFVDNFEEKKRMVTIEHLPVGIYELEFILPNRDGFFINPENKSVSITKDGVTRIDYKILSNNKSIKNNEIAYIPYDINFERPDSEIIFPRTQRRLYSYPALNQPFPRAVLLIKSSLPEATWTILEHGQPVVSGQGANSEVHLLPGINYELKTEDYEGYELTVSPSPNFILSEGQVMTIELRYRRSYGRVAINTSIPSGESIDIVLENNNLQRPIRHKITSLNNQIAWKSTFLPSGIYLLTILAPPYYEPLNPLSIEIKEGQNTNVKLMLKATRFINVSSNNPDGYYFLRSNKDKKIYRGQGSDFTFSNLIPGSYTLTFKTNDPERFIPPSRKQINLSTYNVENPTIFAEYTPKKNAKTIRIKEKKINPPNNPLVHETIKELPKHPLSQLLKVAQGIAIIGDTFSDSQQNTSSVKKIFIKEFDIGLYEITNAQFASWLNQSLKEKKITYTEEGPDKGIVFDTAKKILFKTNSAHPDSQIYTTKLSNIDISFQESPGKGSYPVIFVTWYGAKRFCEYYGCRLPTEAEWEKAAGMAVGDEWENLIKYKYGFASNRIDRSWANYKVSDNSLSQISVNTTPVGFYDGKNLLPLTKDDTTQIRTHNAKSPIGAYDMSGNVWELVDNENHDLNPKEVIAKGGCYDSLADGVRVSERLPLSPEHADAFTGFRVAK